MASIRSEGKAWGKNVIAFEGERRSVSTQLRLLPTSHNVLIIPPLQEYLPEDNDRSTFNAREFVQNVHIVFTKRMETAKTFLQSGQGRKLVFLDGGCVDARTTCLAKICQNLTHGDIHAAETIFHQLTKDGVVGLMRQEEVWVSGLPEEEPFYGNSQGRTSEGQATTDHTATSQRKLLPAQDAFTPESRSKNQNSAMSPLAPGRRDSSENGDDIVNTELSLPSRSPTPPSPSGTASTFGRRAALLKGPVTPATTYTKTGSSKSHNTEELDDDEAGDEDADDPDLISLDAPSPDGQSLGDEFFFLRNAASPVVFGEACIVDVTPKWDVDRRRTSSTGGLRYDARRPSLKHTLSESDYVHAKTGDSGQAIAKLTSEDAYFQTLPRTSFVKASETTIKKSSQSSGSIRSNRSRVEARIYMDRGVGPELSGDEDSLKMAPFQPIFPLTEDLIIRFTAATSSDVFQHVIDSYKNGVYPPLESQCPSPSRSLPSSKNGSPAQEHSYFSSKRYQDFYERRRRAIHQPLGVIGLREASPTTGRDSSKRREDSCPPDIGRRKSEDGQHHFDSSEIQRRQSADRQDKPSLSTVRRRTSHKQDEGLFSSRIKDQSPDRLNSRSRALRSGRTSPERRSESLQPGNGRKPDRDTGRRIDPSAHAHLEHKGLSADLIRSKFSDFAAEDATTPIEVQDAFRETLNGHFPTDAGDFGQQSYTPSVSDSHRTWKPMFWNDDSHGIGKESKTVDHIIALGSQAGVNKEFYAQIFGQVEKLGAKANGMSRSGRLDIRYLVANAMQAFKSHPQANLDPLSNADLLATLLVPQLEAYLAVHTTVRLLVLDYNSNHLSTILALRNILGPDLFKIGGILDAMSSEPPLLGRPQTPPNPLSNEAVALRNLAFTTPRSMVTSMSSSSSRARNSIISKFPVASFSKTDYLLPSNATPGEISVFLSSIQQSLVQKSTWYTPEPASIIIAKPKMVDAATSITSTIKPPTPTSLFPSTYTRPGSSHRQAAGAPSKLSRVTGVQNIGSRPSSPSLRAGSQLNSSHIAALDMTTTYAPSITSTMLSSDGEREKRDREDRDWENFYIQDEDSDDDAYDRMVLGRAGLRLSVAQEKKELEEDGQRGGRLALGGKRKANSRKALKWLGLA